MKISIGSDHAGYKLKQQIIDKFKKVYKFDDKGTTDDVTSVNYPTYAKKVCQSVIMGEANIGILVCGTGIGISIAANKFPGIRAALVYSPEVATLAKEHNNANVICFGERFMKSEDVLESVERFMNANFEPRHQGRINMIKEIEDGTDSNC
jgi:ribose 5-phosphate isomerase B